jgi:hypothetical protein
MSQLTEIVRTVSHSLGDFLRFRCVALSFAFLDATAGWIQRPLFSDGQVKGRPLRGIPYPLALAARTNAWANRPLTQSLVVGSYGCVLQRAVYEPGDVK